MADDCSLSVDDIKKEPEECVSDDLESIDHCFGDDNSIKEESVDNDGIEPAKSDDDLLGYDTRSEVASSVSSDSDSGDGISSKSFDVKRKRHSKSSFSAQDTSSRSKNDASISPLKRNSDEYIGKLNFLFRNARFFIIKSSNAENIALSKTKGVWATLPQNQIKLSEAFRSSENVILIFSAKESGKFSGFARLATGVDRSISPVHWVVPAELSLNLLKGTFRIDWICRNDLPFSFTASLYNPWNSNKPVKIARDSQEVEPRIGEKLCRLFPEDPSVDMAPILRKSKDASKNRGGLHSSAATMLGVRGGGASKALYTAKYRLKMLQHPLPHNVAHQRNHAKEAAAVRKSFLARRVHDVASGRISKQHYKQAGVGGSKDGSLRGNTVAAIEAYAKRFGHAFRPPMPPHGAMGAMRLAGFMPPRPPHHGSEMFASPQFAGHMTPFGLQPPHLPRYYEPVPPSFAHHFHKMNPMHHHAAAAAAAAASKNLYDRSVEEFLRKTREKEYYAAKKAERSKRKEAESGGKSRRAYYRDRERR